MDFPERLRQACPGLKVATDAPVLDSHGRDWSDLPSKVKILDAKTGKPIPDAYVRSIPRAQLVYVIQTYLRRRGINLPPPVFGASRFLF